MECDESQSVSGFCLATEVRNSRSSFVDPLLRGAPPWMVPVRWINYLVRCGPCLCLLFCPTARGQMTLRNLLIRIGVVNGYFIRPFLSNGDFHWPILTRAARHCWKCVYLTGQHSAVKLRRHSLRTPLFFEFERCGMVLLSLNRRPYGRICAHDPPGGSRFYRPRSTFVAKQACWWWRPARTEKRAPRALTIHGRLSTLTIPLKYCSISLGTRAEKCDTEGVPRAYRCHTALDIFADRESMNDQ